MRKLIFILLLGMLTTTVAEGQLYHIKKIHQVKNGIPVNTTEAKSDSYFSVQKLGNSTYSVKISTNAEAIFDFQVKYVSIINGFYAYKVIRQKIDYLSVNVVLTDEKLSLIAEGKPLTASIGFLYHDESKNIWEISRY